MNSHLSWPGVTAAARCHLHGTRRADAYCPSAVLLRIGFAEPCGSPHAGELLPRLSTLTHQKVCGISLLHFPWGHPRRPLAVILALWSSDFPQTPAFAWRPQLFSLLANFIVPAKHLLCQEIFSPGDRMIFSAVSSAVKPVTSSLQVFRLSYNGRYARLRPSASFCLVPF